MIQYIKVEWPEIQDYMNHPDYQKEVGYDPNKDCWFVPEEWDDYVNEMCGGDLEDALG